MIPLLPVVRSEMTIAAAAVVSHQPGIMLPDGVRQKMPGGDFSLIEGFAEMRKRLKEKNVECLVIFDTHWFTTTQHIVAGADTFSGEYTSEELPNLINDHPYNFLGSPELATQIKKIAKENSIPCINSTSKNLPLHYPTINLVHWLNRDELKDVEILSVSCCQTAEDHNFLQMGEVVAEAARRCGKRVALLGSGGMTHTFPTLDNANNHNGKNPDGVLTAAARAKDESILGMWGRGEHGSVLEQMPVTVITVTKN